MRGEQGFTIVELLVSLAILLTVTAGVFTMLDAAVQRSPVWNDAADLHQRARVAVDAMAAAVRNARAVALAPAAITLSPAPDPETGVADADVTFYLDAASGTLRRAQGGGDFPLVDAIEDLRAELLDAVTRRVRLTIQLRASLAGRLTIVTDVVPRSVP